MSTFLVVTLLLSVPTIPLVLYAIGLLFPPEHKVTRSIQYKTTAEILWVILTSVEDYPAWRSNISQVTVEDDEGDYNKYEEKNRTEFVEYSIKKDRRVAVTHIEQGKERKLLRIIEEKSTLEDHSPTFTGFWTFLIEPVEGEKLVNLKITEQGTIRKPMVRGLNKLIFGYHRRIDRFMKDLGKEIELGILEQTDENVNLEEIAETSENELGPDESLMESKTFVDKDWDIVSEIYEKK